MLLAKLDERYLMRASARCELVEISFYFSPFVIHVLPLYFTSSSVPIS